MTGTDDATAEVRPDQNAGMRSCGEGFGAFHMFFPCTNCYLMTFLSEIALYSLHPSAERLAFSTFCDALVANHHDHLFS